MSFIVTHTEHSVATITLHRPEKLNAFTGTMREDLLEAFRACDADRAIRVVVLTGSGRAFCAGGDVDYMYGLQQKGDVAAFRKLLDAGRDLILQIVTMTKPVIAAVNGIAAGAGCNLALACDYRIVSEAAKFSESFVKIGLHPDWGGTWLLPRIVGRSRATELLMTGRMIDAHEAQQIGIADRVVSPVDLATETHSLSHALALAPPIAVAGIRKALIAAELEALRAQLDLEAEHQVRCFLSKDAREGMAAFFDKRVPEFVGE